MAKPKYSDSEKLHYWKNQLMILQHKMAQAELRVKQLEELLADPKYQDWDSDLAKDLEKKKSE